jgi:hypothetical protein
MCEIHVFASTSRLLLSALSSTVWVMVWQNLYLHGSHKCFSYPTYILYVLTHSVSPFSDAQHIAVGSSTTVLIIWWIFATFLTIYVAEVG